MDTHYNYNVVLSCPVILTSHLRWYTIRLSKQKCKKQRNHITQSHLIDFEAYYFLLRRFLSPILLVYLVRAIPLPSNSHHQDYYILSKGFRTKPCHVPWFKGQPRVLTRLHSGTSGCKWVPDIAPMMLRRCESTKQKSAQDLPPKQNKQ